MGLLLNTGYTGRIVPAKADGSLYSNIFGTGNYVLASGDQLAAELNDNFTELYISSGDIVMGGRHGYIAYDDDETVTLSGGASGYNRIDLVCAHYVKAASGIESMEFAVVEGEATTGTATAPSYTTGEITEGASEVYFPLYQVTYTGLDAELTCLFTDNIIQPLDHVSENLYLHNHYGTCSTAAATAAKVVTTDDDFVLTTGVSIKVRFSNANSASSPTLNVNSTGAVAMASYGTTAATTYEWAAGGVVEFVYDGSRWIIEDGTLATTTYYGRTKLSSSTSSTSTALAATSSAVKAAYDLATTAQSAAEAAQETADANTETLDNLEVGGRNYFQRTRDMAKNTLYSSNITLEEDSEGFVNAVFGAVDTLTWNGITQYGFLYSMIRDKEITVSFEYCGDELASTERGITLSFSLGTSPIYGENGYYFRSPQLNITDVSADWKKYSITLTASDSYFSSVSSTSPTLSSYDTAYFFIRFYNYATSGVKLRKFKLELGNTPTDWTPAPEDFEDKFDALGYVEVEVPSSGWSSSAPYTQSVTVSGMTSDWIPGNPVLVASGTSSTDIAAQEAFACVSTIASGTDTLTFTCYEDLPESDFTIRIPGLISA